MVAHGPAAQHLQGFPLKPGVTSPIQPRREGRGVFPSPLSLVGAGGCLSVLGEQTRAEVSMCHMMVPCFRASVAALGPSPGAPRVLAGQVVCVQKVALGRRDRDGQGRRLGRVQSHGEGVGDGVLWSQGLSPYPRAWGCGAPSPLPPSSSCLAALGALCFPTVLGLRCPLWMSPRANLSTPLAKKQGPCLGWTLVYS